MENLNKTLPSGTHIEITIGSFQESHRLFKAVVKELGAVKLSAGVTGLDIDRLDIKNMDASALEPIKNLICNLIISDEVESALWPCMQRGECTMNGKKQKINMQAFEENRGDFYLIAKEVLWFNLSPFLSNLGSLLKTESPLKPGPQM